MKTLTVLSYVSMLLVGANLYLALSARRVSNLLKSALGVLMSLFIWVFSYTFLYMAPTEAIAWRLIHIGSIGWITLPASSLIFFLDFTGVEITNKKSFTIYLPTLLILCYSYISGKMPGATELIYSRNGLGWLYINDIGNELFWAYMLVFVLYFGYGLWRLFSATTTSLRSMAKGQAMVLGIVDAVLVSISFVVEFITPLYVTFIPPISNLTVILFSITLYIVIRRFDLFNIRNMMEGSEVFKSLKEGILILNADRVIVRSNRSASSILGYTRDELSGVILDSLLIESFEDDGFIGSQEAAEAMHETEVMFRKKQDGSIPVVISVNAMSDPYLGFIGYVAVFSEIGWRIRMAHDLKSNSEKYMKLSEELEHLANYDLLTNLPNRRLFYERMNKLLEEGVEFGVYYLDLNGFKAINDHYGHSIGDKALVHTAELLTAYSGDEGFVARISGDEFIMIDMTANPVNHKIKGDEIKALFAREFVIDKHKCHWGISVGFANSKEYQDVDDLVREADLNMYQDKLADGEVVSC